MPPQRDSSGRFVKTPRGGEVSVKWTDDLGPGLNRAAAFVIPYVDAVLEHDSGESQNDMRVNAPWTDRTSNARNGLFAKAFVEGGEHGEVLYHTMDYGIWLELANSGKYRIIWPSTLRAGRRVMKGLRELFRAM